MLAVGRRRRVCEAVEVIGIKERREVRRAIALVSSEVARDDEVVDVDGRLRYDVVRDVGGERRPRKHFLEHVERQLFLVAVPERPVASDGPHVLAHERVVGRIDVMFRVRIGEETAVQRVEHVEVEVAHVAQRDGGERHRNRHHLDRHLLREVEEAPEHFGDLNGEHEAGRDADDGPYTATDGRPRLDHLGNTVQRRPIGEVQQNVGSFHVTW